MKYDYNLKSAVALAVSLLSLGMHQNAFALGLGDINVSSYLGQPLEANIKVFDVEEANNASCYKLTDSNLSNVNLALRPIQGGQATLVLTTNQVVSEPIVNLSIVTQCGSQFQRDYVLLLDPLLTTDIETAEISGLIDNEAIKIVEIDNSVDNSTINSLATAIVRTIKLMPKKDIRRTELKPKRNNIALKRNAAKQFITVDTMKVKSKNTNQANKNISGEKAPNRANITPEQVIRTIPKLKISGDSSNLKPANIIGLQLEKQLVFTTNPNVMSLDDVEIQDEIVVMNNRVENLQLELTKLQQQNSQLKMENKVKTEALVSANNLKNNFSSILYILGGGLLLAAGYFSFNWLRNRKLKNLANILWASPVASVNENPSIDDLPTLSSALKESTASIVLTEVKSGQNVENNDIEFETTMHANEAIVFEDDETQILVLDHADVFLSHGRKSLAIQLLQNHLLDNPKQSVTIWLFLLDLLAKENLKTVYSQTAIDCKQYFNIKITDFTTSEEIQSNQTLESFPRLQKGLEDVWGKPESIIYLDDLIYNNRLEPRAGLEKGLIEELLLLKTIAQENGNSAEVIQLDQKKLKILKVKEELLSTTKAKKIEELQESILEKQASEEKPENLFEFELADWK